MSTDKFKEKGLIPADPNQKISFFKKIQMRLWLKREKFKFFRKNNKYWKYYTSKIEDIFNFGICGTLIALPFFHPSVITFGLAFGSALWIYSNKIHSLLLQIISNIRIVNIEGGNRK
jgi:hypothetical protein